MLGLGLEKKIMYPSDYPHERPTLERVPGDIPRFRARKIFRTKFNMLILSENYVDSYSFSI